jgi:cytochrome c5
MKNAVLNIVVVFFVYACIVLSCSEVTKEKQPPVATGPTNLNSFVTKLPEAPGYATFQRNCLSCHSARYVQMQPAFSEKTWMAIVTKMQKNFGAQVSDSSVKDIVQYLVAIKGKG